MCWISTASRTMRALSRDLHGRTVQAAGRNADAAPPTPTNTCGTAAAPSGLFLESLGQWRTANATARRTAVDWAHQVRALVDHPRYRQAERLTLVCDNLNIHAYASFYRAFPPAEARRRARRVRLVFTPRHGRWLNNGRTGTERPDAAGPGPAHGHAGRCPRAGRRLGGGP